MPPPRRPDAAPHDAAASENTGLFPSGWDRIDVVEHARSAPPPVAAARRDRVALRAVPWLIPAVTLVTALIATGTRPADVALYAAYLAFAVVLPGTLVHRALRGSRGNLPEDLGLGAATGLLLMLAGWALGAATGVPALPAVWPLLIVAPFVAVARLRPAWRIPADRRNPAPALFSWLTAAGLTGVVLVVLPFWVRTPLPPATTEYYGDLLYHLGLVHEMTRSMPFQVPQMTGDTLRYHYLADADMAAASMVTGIAPEVVLLRLWTVPVLAVTALVVAALTRRLTGRWWAAAVAGPAALVAAPLTLGAPVAPFGGSPLSIVSPSHTYALALVALLLTLAVDAVDGRPLRRAWLLVPPLALACAGAKSSALPPVVAGLALAAVLVAVTRRRRLASVAAFLGWCLAAMAAGTKLFAGGGAGTIALQPFAVLYWSRPYRQTLGGADVIDGRLRLPAGVEHASTGGLLFLGSLVLWWIVMQAPRLLGLLTLTGGHSTSAGGGATARGRAEPEAWLLGGMTVAAAGAAWLLWHPSASQVYFYLGVAPFAVVSTVWLLARRATGPGPALAGLAAGFLWVLFGPSTPTPGAHTMRAWTEALWLPVLWTALAVVMAATAGLLIRHAVTDRRERRALNAGSDREAGQTFDAVSDPATGQALDAVYDPVTRQALDAASEPEAGRALGAVSDPEAGRANGGVFGRGALRTVGVALVAAVLGGGVATGVEPSARALHRALTHQGNAAVRAGHAVYADEARAALWLGEQAGPYDVVATNVHCRPLRPVKVCDARAFWVSGLTGRRTLIESWGYTDQALAADGRNGLRYALQPAPYGERFALNQRVFVTAESADVTRLRDVYRVRWLFADRRAPGGVTPLLGRVARLQYVSGPVSIYELR